MPRDKTASHEKIVKAAMKEFLEKGYERASMKSVADEVGMTSAALYRHFANKQDMFAALVQPVVDAIQEWTRSHTQMSVEAVNVSEISQIWDFDSGISDARLVLDVLYDMPEVSVLLLFRSAGTPYESFLHDIVESSTDSMMSFVELCRNQGYPAKDMARDEMHMLVTAYTTAMVQPLEHGYSRQEAERYLRLMMEFFVPGWRMVTGL